mmetsp:Transcript_21502/g.62945  ORF Transcript_21502/g.62945 Transcript_21502/m.62945 type:complete len:162 (+) Transcript_21502:964-1449(+)
MVGRIMCASSGDVRPRTAPPSFLACSLRRKAKRADTVEIVCENGTDCSRSVQETKIYLASCKWKHLGGIGAEIAFHGGRNPSSWSPLLQMKCISMEAHGIGLNDTCFVSKRCCFGWGTQMPVWNAITARLLDSTGALWCHQLRVAMSKYSSLDVFEYILAM